MGAAIDAAQAEAPSAAPTPAWATAGLWVVALLAVAGSAVLLWAASGVGSFFLWLAALGLLGPAGMGWVGGVTLAVIARVRRHPVADDRWLLVPVVVVALAAGLVVLHVPFAMRWAHSRSAFEEVAEQADPDLPRSQTRWIDGVDRLGTYAVTDVWQQGEAVVFTLDAGLDDEGVAYLPEGPFPELEDGGAFESPEYRSLGGGWYRWTASW